MAGLLRTTRLIAGLRLTRMANQWHALQGRKRPADPAARRTGTARKGGVGSILGFAFIALIMAINPIHMTSRLLEASRKQLGPVRDLRGRFEIHDRQFWKLVSPPRGDDPLVAEGIEAALARETARYPAPQRETWRRMLSSAYAARGADGFVRTLGGGTFLPELAAWHSPGGSARLLRVAAALLAVLCATWLCLALGSANQDLGKVEWTFEWLFSFPVPAAHLFLAQTLGYAIIDPLMWVGAWPVLFTLFWSAGYGWWGLALGAAGALYLSVLIASGRVVGETLLRKRFAPPALKNLQALFTVAGTLGLLLLLANAGASSLTAGLLGAAMRLPAVIDWLPVALPAWGCLGPGALARSCAIGAMLGVAAPVVASAGCAWLVRGGLVTASGVYVGARRPAVARPPRRFAPRGIVGKDVHLLLRDRNFLVQTLVVPVLAIAFQVVVNSSVLDAVTSSFQHAAVLAFSMGGYVLIATALSVLAVEGNALWMLYTVPRALERIMLEKTCLWAGFALLYGATVLGVCAWFTPVLQAGDAVFAALALLGVFIYAFIASGLGILATDPLEPEVRRRVRTEMVQLYMLLAAMYAHALYSPSAWTRLGQIILSALLALALWQKVRDRAPFLLDPVAAPPPSISLADGLIAALAFFVLQGLVMIGATMAEVPASIARVLGFVLAGAVTAFFALSTFWRLKVPGLLVTLGLRRAARGGSSWVGSIALGAGAGIAAGTFAWVYLKALAFFPALQRLQEESAPMALGFDWWLVVLAVVVAPLFEEFIFRGLVFRGLRRSAPATMAILGSAAIFAIVHPPISVLPVFLLGILAAWVFERSGLLVSSIAAHMVYNAIVLGVKSGG